MPLWLKRRIAACRSVFVEEMVPGWPSFTCLLPFGISLKREEKKRGRPENSGQKKSQQTKRKQIKSTLIKHRCWKENKLGEIYGVLTKLGVCAKDIRNNYQVMPFVKHPSFCFIFLPLPLSLKTLGSREIFLFVESDKRREKTRALKNLAFGYSTGSGI